MRKRRPFLLALVVFVVTGSALTWRVYPDLHQRQIDNRLLAAISRSDTPAVLSLLDQGANPNAHGDPNAGNMSLWQILREYFMHRTSRPHQDVPALQIALGIHVSEGKEIAIFSDRGTGSMDVTGSMGISGNDPVIKYAGRINISTSRDAKVLTALLQHGGTMRPVGQVVFHPYVKEDPQYKQYEIGFTLRFATGAEAIITLSATPQQLLDFRKATKMDEKR